MRKVELEFCYQYLQDREIYHNHKEYMAYIGLGIELAFFGGFVAVECKKIREWEKLINTVLDFEYALAIVVIVLWLFMHLFVRWQLIMRRDAAFHVLVLRNLILGELTRGSCKYKCGGNSCERNGENKKKCRFFYHCLDYLFPVICAPEFKDKEKYPGWYQSEFDKCKKNPPKIPSEWVIATGSFFMLILMLVKVEAFNLCVAMIVGVIGLVAILMLVCLCSQIIKQEC